MMCFKKNGAKRLQEPAFCVFLILCVVSLLGCGDDKGIFSSAIKTIKLLPIVDAGKSEAVLTLSFNTPEYLPESGWLKFPEGFSVKKGEGRNASNALFYERAEAIPDNYKLYTIPLKELEPFIMSTQRPLPIMVESEPKNAVEAGALLDDNGNYRIIVIGIEGKAKGTFTLPENLQKMKTGLRSKYGKTKSLGDGKFEFTSVGVDSDILE